MTEQGKVKPADESGVVHKEVYFDPAYVQLEKDRLWARVWQVACRVEELKAVGDYVTYEIGDESVIIVRSSETELRAFYNVCQHRGRRLTEGCGKAQRFRCPFHGWQWRLDGTNAFVNQRDDWGGLLDDQDLSLQSVKLDTWGGWVFVNFDPDCEPLLDYLGEAAQILAPFELEKMRYRWRKWMVIPCNWKIGLEAFNEGYHVSVTHSQLKKFGPQPRYFSAGHGRHGMFGTFSETGTLASGQTKDGATDLRPVLKDMYAYLKWALDSNMSVSFVDVAAKLPETVPDNTPPAEVIGEFMRQTVEADAAKGIQWPAITPDEYQRAGIDWHIFPNTVLLPMASNCLGYRARPNGDDPNSCIFEVYHIERFAEGAEPVVENVRNDDIYDYDFWGEILPQDFQQMQGTHKGVKSRGYKGPRLNPREEQPVANFHRVYNEYIGKE